MSFLDSRIEIGATISAITQEHANRAIHLIEQRCNVRAVVDVTTGQRASDNFARDCVQADMQFVPCAALCCSMLFDPPIARTIQLRPVLSTINCRGPTGRRVHFGKATV
jgi:hypothetical protein